MEIQQTNFKPRGLVIELSVKIEHATNLILAQLLGINSDSSRSFGTSNQALSFNAKANLLLDLNQLDKLQREKFQIFMEVRNKFAHLSSVDTFEKCFTLTGNYQRLKKIFEVDKDGESIEEDMETMFSILSIDITSTLAQIRKNVLKDMAKRYTQRRWIEVVTERRDEYKQNNPSHVEAVDNFIHYMKNILLQEVDEKIANGTPPHV